VKVVTELIEKEGSSTAMVRVFLFFGGDVLA